MRDEFAKSIEAFRQRAEKELKRMQQQSADQRRREEQRRRISPRSACVPNCGSPAEGETVAAVNSSGRKDGIARIRDGTSRQGLSLRISSLSPGTSPLCVMCFCPAAPTPQFRGEGRVRGQRR